MKEQLKQLIHDAIVTLVNNNVITIDLNTIPAIELTLNRDDKHGDVSSNIALLLAKIAHMNPRELAQHICQHLKKHECYERTDVAGAGFINFYLAAKIFYSVIPQILIKTHDYGKSEIGKGQRVIIEFVSANPTGPLHVGHGRGAAYGACVAALLQATGYEVHREYYVNDAGRQMDILATSVWLRYLELCGHQFTFPVNAYKGAYVIDIAQALKRQVNDQFNVELPQLFTNDLPLDEQPDGSGDKEAYIDAVISRAKSLLNEQYYQQVFALSLNVILDDIREDLAEFGVHYDQWFHESSLKHGGFLDREISALRANDCLYEKDGAVWFKATGYGDEQDRVILRANGQPTYFAADVAYHLSKYERGFNHIIDIFGADHHGYAPRVKASMKALRQNSEAIQILLVQFAVLYRGKEKVQMSTRSGEFVTLRQLREEVGNDAARFFYVSRKAEQHMDFDLELAKSQSNDNPVYYIQYAHARISSVFRQLHEKYGEWDELSGLKTLDQLTHMHEKFLMIELIRYPDVILQAARDYEPHLIANYLRDLAQSFHGYYNGTLFLVDDEELRNARLALCKATQQVLKNGLELLGLTAPEHM